MDVVGYDLYRKLYISKGMMLEFKENGPEKWKQDLFGKNFSIQWAQWEVSKKYCTGIFLAGDYFLNPHRFSTQLDVFKAAH